MPLNTVSYCHICARSATEEGAEPKHSVNVCPGGLAASSNKLTQPHFQHKVASPCFKAYELHQHLAACNQATLNTRQLSCSCPVVCKQTYIVLKGVSNHVGLVVRGLATV